MSSFETPWGLDLKPHISAFSRKCHPHILGMSSTKMKREDKECLGLADGHRDSQSLKGNEALLHFILTTLKRKIAFSITLTIEKEYDG